MKQTITSMASASVLPHDVVKHIIGFVNTASLKACGLVCLSWFHASRPRLFRSLCIDSNNRRSIFNTFQDAPLPYCTSYCTSLEIVHAEWLFDVDGATFREFILQFSSTLVTLTLSHTICPSTSHLLIAVIPLGRLRCLSLNFFQLENQTPDTYFLALGRTSPIERLHIRNSNLRRIFAALNATHVFGNVIHLKMGDIQDADFPEIGKFLLQHLGLQDLSVSFAHNTVTYTPHLTAEQYFNEEKDTQSSIHAKYRQRYGSSTSPFLRQLYALRTLHIRNFVDSREPHHQSTALIWAPKALASVSSLALQHIVLTLYLERAGQIDQFNIDWVFLDEILNGDNYSDVEAIIFENLGPANLASLQDLVSARLPRCAARSLLQFSFG
ncbi:hypothetical protein BJ165DRAFT_1501344 [Panaeolus papilionaceus]|nr:hypothetical protein BJ165DRAFT_1501344 [Panaeolus papilionaceus]